ncbi:isoleucine--tRNA ligase [Dubosiella newyorkensis]|jgi:isoleucyl-tRNA synthetase|uniref:isoleucine--tRNA ligase n=1 Tax=Dubosiella newyorkensis TaxID=1862672 RepID=UPI0023545D3E|nr:isoleucine--tRNA ligase [Dubosiella newyorkensis]MCI9041536.1 isoleucine--tRNA ligase [Dubosiella newyorkensis]
MDYKETLHMPKTAFEMRGNLTKKEPKYQKRWEEERLYDKMLVKREGAESFVLHDGPPYANGDIHLGHALNKILKDVINRSKFMEGYKVPYIPGWDTHGLPIETAVTKLGFDRKKMNIADFRKICYDYALEQVEKQKAGFLSLGSVGDYDHPYITLTKDFEARQIEIFGKMAMDGLIYKGLKPVYWSPSSESALAEAEVEYKDIKSPTIYVKFQVKDGKGILDQDTYFVIWTTTPWTIPGNKGIALHPNMEYALINTNKGKLVVLNELIEELMPKFNIDEYSIEKTFKGKELESITTIHPLYDDRESLVVLADYVTADAGTGCVHTAPAFGVDDFNTGMRYGLDMDVNVDEQGKLMASTGKELEGQYVEDANKTVTQMLDANGSLLNLTFITHSYPHDWRTKKPIIFRATTQWFASIDKIRDQLLDQIHSISWVPSWGEGRMHNMIADRGDWCISRQRAWGVPIPIFYGEDDTPIMDEEVFKHVAALFAEHGSNIWFEKEAKELLPEGYTNEHSPNGIFRKEVDTMDVWFDSGSSHTGAMKERGLGYPADLYFEGSDQYRGWFNSSLIIGTAVYGEAPYKQVLSHGFVMDEKGVKMSKSQWNSVAPSEITKKYGADILRLWATSVDYQADCSMGQNILKQVAENYRKVRNTFRFLMANLDNNTFTKENLVPVNELSKLNQYILVKLNEVIRASIKAYNEYRFADVVSMLTNFMTNELSAYYLDYTKDILYIENIDDPERRQVQTVLYECLDALTRLWAPILVHTCEEINDFMHFDEESIHLAAFKEIELDIDERSLLDKMQRILLIRKDVLKALEIARNAGEIKKSLEAHLVMSMDEEDQKIFDELIQNPAQWLIVSKVDFVKADLPSYENCQIEVKKAEGHVCPRCWNYTTSEHEDGLCDRCARILEKE